jgi:hypothetical protein
MASYRDSYSILTHAAIALLFVVPFQILHQQWKGDYRSLKESA